MNREQALRLAPLLDPLVPAPPELYVERPDPTLLTLREAWAYGSAKVRHCLLVGARGSGKSSELRHLATQVSLEADAPLVTLLRLQDQLDTAQVSAAQVLFLIGVTGLALVPKPPPRQLASALEHAYAHIVEGGERVEVSEILGRLAAFVGGAAKAGGHPFIGALTSGAGQLMKTARLLALPGKGLKLSANQTAVIALAEAVNEALKWTRGEYMQAPLAFFVDGLDRLDPSSVDELFGTGVLSMPSCPVVYAAPLALRYTNRGIPLGRQFSFLTVHNFPVFHKREPARPNPSAYAAMRTLLRLRLDAAQIEPAQLLDGGFDAGGIVDLAIETSGGVTQVFLALLDKSLRRALIRANGQPFVITRALFDSVIADEREELALRLLPSQRAMLGQLARSFERPEGDDADALLYDNVVLSYPDSPAWYLPSPLMRPYLEADAARAAQEVEPSPS